MIAISWLDSFLVAFSILGVIGIVGFIGWFFTWALENHERVTLWATPFILFACLVIIIKLAGEK